MALAASEKLLGRRNLLRLFGALAVACTGTRSTTPSVDPIALEPFGGAREPFGGRVQLWSWFDLPKGASSAELSGIAWEEATRTLWAVQDDTPQLVDLHPDARLESWSFGSGIRLHLDAPLDLEGIVVLPHRGGFVVCNEEGPQILELGRDGTLRREIVLPAHYRTARTNQSLESLAISPDGRYLFTTSEVALAADGDPPTGKEGTRVRIARIDRATDAFVEHAYLTDPAVVDGADHGVAELAALSKDDLLVLERGWARGVGNNGRIYRVLLDERAFCAANTPLTPASALLSKSLLVDLARLEARGLPAALAPQPAPILDNYEGMALGPRLPDGRRSLLVVSDDNARDDQVARLLVLAVG